LPDPFFIYFFTPRHQHDFAFDMGGRLR